MEISSVQTSVSTTPQEEYTFIIDGRVVSLKEFQTIRRDPAIRLIEISHRNFKTLERMYG